ncbi:hypothetical protein [Kitasatospora phosalacinea]|uniref:Uncharacterized protein n=1 Tax=Kitasatospora phosalacinea TaxID=2065 RepID=A0ABW6GFQ7_9ACTN
MRVEDEQQGQVGGGRRAGTAGWGDAFALEPGAALVPVSILRRRSVVWGNAAGRTHRPRTAPAPPFSRTPFHPR